MPLMNAVALVAR